MGQLSFTADEMLGTPIQIKNYFLTYHLHWSCKIVQDSLRGTSKGPYRAVFRHSDSPVHCQTFILAFKMGRSNK